jgi:hypothetical protein
MEKVDESRPAPLGAASPPRVVTANELRWLGEEADAKRGGDYVVVWREDANGKLRLGLEPKDSPAAATAIPVETIEVSTRFEGPGMMSDDAHLVISYNGQTFDLVRDKPGGGVERADAVFLTQSSYSKFVTPYYARFRSTGKLDDMRRNYFLDENVIAVVHFPPSDDKAVSIEDGAFESPITNVRALRVDRNTGGLMLVAPE